MTKEQNTVAIGAASGTLMMVLMVWGLASLIPAPQHVHSLADRIAFTLQINVFAALPLLIMIAYVGNSRFLSAAINPLARAETDAQIINGRVADNTLQQNFLFLVGTLGLSTVLEEIHLQVLVALAIVFVLARVAFWIGYRMNPLYRAPGMAATAYINLGVYVYAAYLVIL